MTGHLEGMGGYKMKEDLQEWSGCIRCGRKTLYKMGGHNVGILEGDQKITRYRECKSGMYGWTQIETL